MRTKSTLLLLTLLVAAPPAARAQQASQLAAGMIPFGGGFAPGPFQTSGTGRLVFGFGVYSGSFLSFDFEVLTLDDLTDVTTQQPTVWIGPGDPGFADAAARLTNGPSPSNKIDALWMKIFLYPVGGGDAIEKTSFSVQEDLLLGTPPWSGVDLRGYEITRIGFRLEQFTASSTPYTPSVPQPEPWYSTDTTAIVSVFVEGRPSATTIAADVQTALGNLPSASLKNGNANLANALSSKVQEVIDMVAAADAESDAVARSALYQEAIDKIQNDLMKKCDADPRGNWITDAADAQALYDLLVNLRDAILAKKNA